MIPYFLLKRPIPVRVPVGMKKVVAELQQMKNREQCLRRAYDIVTTKYHGDSIKTYTRFYEIFAWDVDTLWKRKGFLHCTHLNFVLRVLLIKSGHFSDNDIQLKMTNFWGAPHEYLLVHVGGKKFMNVDPWSKAFGVKFGEYMNNFA
jgi:hypothetical protein